MNQDLSTKKYPATTPEVARMLKLDTQNSSLNHQEATTVVPLADLPVADLPVAPAKPTGAAAAPDVLSQVVGTIVPDASRMVFPRWWEICMLKIPLPGKMPRR